MMTLFLADNTIIQSLFVQYDFDVMFHYFQIRWQSDGHIVAKSNFTDYRPPQVSWIIYLRSEAWQYLCSVILIYDTLLTFGIEREHVWRYKTILSFGSILYLTTRYGGIALLVSHYFFLLHQDPGVSRLSHRANALLRISSSKNNYLHNFIVSNNQYFQDVRFNQCFWLLESLSAHRIHG